MLVLNEGQAIAFQYTKRNGEVKNWEGFVKRVEKSKAGVNIARMEVFGKREIVPRTFHIERMKML